MCDLRMGQSLRQPQTVQDFQWDRGSDLRDSIAYWDGRATASVHRYSTGSSRTSFPPPHCKCASLLT